MAKILVVDDEPDIVNIVERILKKHGFETMGAYSGEETLNILKKEKPDLILLDIMMPGMDGWETAKKIKENPETKDIPIVFLTIRGEEEDQEKSFIYSKANAHITKPIIEEKLIATIKWVLKTSKKIEK